jgi:hypothetical protein
MQFRLPMKIMTKGEIKKLLEHIEFNANKPYQAHDTVELETYVHMLVEAFRGR